jgi:hypothetical protein
MYFRASACCRLIVRREIKVMNRDLTGKKISITFWCNNNYMVCTLKNNTACHAMLWDRLLFGKMRMLM